jgi:hypothetical protein
MRGKQALGDRFRHAMSSKFTLRQSEQKLGNAQRACRQLDESHHVTLNFMWFNSHDTSSSSALRYTYDPLYDSFAYELEYSPEIEQTKMRYSHKTQTIQEKMVACEDQLDEILTYLRHRYFFCLFCGAQFTDANDLKRNCPGILEQDH